MSLAVAAIQLLVALRFFLYCDENLEDGTSRATVCHAADDGGYLVGIVLPPAIVLAACLVALHRRSVAIVWAVFAVALLMGIAVPLTVGVVAGYR